MKKILAKLEWVFFDVVNYSRDMKVRYLRVGWVLTALFGGVIALILLLGGGLIAVDRHFSKQSCEARGELIGTDEYTWRDFTFFDYGCYRVDERGTTSDNYSRILIEE